MECVSEGYYLPPDLPEAEVHAPGCYRSVCVELKVSALIVTVWGLGSRGWCACRPGAVLNVSRLQGYCLGFRV